MKLKLLLLCLAVPVMGMAESTFETIVNQIKVNNPRMQALRAGHTAEIMQRHAENRLEATEAEFEHKWGSIAEAGTKMGVSVSQGFDWPGVYGARRRAARSLAAAQSLSYQAGVRDLELQARTLLLQVVDANLRRRMLSEILANLDSIHYDIHVLLDLRQVTEIDHRKVKLERIALLQQLLEAETGRSEALASLGALYGGELPPEVAELSEYPEQTLRPLSAYVERPDPAEAALQAEAETALIDSRVERMGLLPGFSVGAAMEREDGTNFFGFTLGVRLPQYGAASAAKAAELRALSARLQAEQVRRERMAELEGAHLAATRAEQLLKDYTEALGTDYPEMLMTLLNGGQITYADYLTEINFYLGARLDYLSRLLDYHTRLTFLTLK